jgi:hypothetical protein
MQLAFMLGRQQVFLELPDTMEDCEDLNEILSNANLSNHFVALAREVLIRYNLLYINQLQHSYYLQTTAFLLSPNYSIFLIN